MKTVGGRFALGELVAVQGDPECTDPRHDHRWVRGEMIPGCRTGYHCPRCGADVPMTGHRGCPPSPSDARDEGRAA